MIRFTSNCCAVFGLKMQKMQKKKNRGGDMYAVRFEVLTVAMSSVMLHLTASNVK
jgi:hypothetical protein